MSEQAQSKSLTRRKFLQRGAVALALGATAGVAARGWFQQRKRRALLKDKNPFAYEVGHLSQTDPRLITHHEVARFALPRSETRRLVCGPNGHLYLAAGNYVSILEPNGTLISEIALSGPGRCVAVAGDFVYVGLRDHVEVFHHNGKHMASWEKPADRTWFTGLAVGSYNLFAADAGNRVILRYDLSGKLISRLGEKNAARNIPGFVVPSPFFGAEIAPDGLLRVNNPGRHQVEAYTTDGEFEFAWGDASAALGGFCGCCNPISLAVLPDGRCITCEKGLPRVKIYNSQGKFESVVAGPESFPENAAKSKNGDFTGVGLDVAADSHGRIFILDLTRNEIRVMERKSIAAPA